MNVAQLKKLLEKYPDELEILTDQHSDYAPLDENECVLIKAVPGGGGWLMRSHPTMSAENKAKEREYLYLGN